MAAKSSGSGTCGGIDAKSMGLEDIPGLKACWTGPICRSKSMLGPGNVGIEGDAIPIISGNGELPSSSSGITKRFC